MCCRSNFRRSLLGAITMLGVVSAGPALAAWALTCAPTEVEAKGEEARYRWLALVKARGNWRGKVRAMPGLGSAYATWSRAADPVERCILDQRTVVCTVTARPCRR